MAVAAQQTREWIDGFLFVGNHPALDFLNTSLVNGAGPVELLPDTASLERWLRASGILHASPAWGDLRAAQSFLRDLLTFRESLRAAVLRWQTGRVPEQFLGELNLKLLAYPRRYTLKRIAGSVQRKTFLELRKPDDLWSEIAGFASDLFTDVPSSRVRKCEGCVVNFYDISKKGSRRWCSTHLCGNRDKVAAHRMRQRGTVS